MGFGECVAEALDIMRQEKKYYKDFLPSSAIQIGNNVLAVTENLNDELKDKIVQLMKVELPLESSYGGVWWYSVLINLCKDKNTFLEMIKFVREKQNVFSENTLYYLFYQLISINFRFATTDGADVKMELWKLFIEIVNQFKQKFTDYLEPIPLENRNQENYVVITEQLISVQHGPTKTCLDRCKTLIERLGKNVIIINTAEILSQIGKIPFAQARIGSYDPSKLSEKQIEWKGVNVPYYQCERDMPDIDKLKELLGVIRELKPGRVVAIGGTSVLANLVNEIVPVVTVGLGPADLEYTTTEFQTLSRTITESDMKMITGLGLREDHIIESVFTSSLKPQTEQITRDVYNVTEDKFVMVVVGARLGDEVTDEFLNVLESVLNENMYVAFLGYFAGFDQIRDRHPKIKEQLHFWGFCSDILSRMEICDLYINPKRKGGGTSCVEALYKGIPVVTLDYGDVSVNVGKDFCVNTYEEYIDIIAKYYNNKEFYQSMSEKAKERVKILLDTDTEFVRILEEVNKRELNRE